MVIGISSPSAHSPMRVRVSVAEHRLLAAGQDRAHPPPLARQYFMADEIDLREVADEPSDTESVSDLLLTETERTELPMGNRPVLNARKRGDPMIQAVSW